MICCFNAERGGGNITTKGTMSTKGGRRMKGKNEKDQYI